MLLTTLIAKSYAAGPTNILKTCVGKEMTVRGGIYKMKDYDSGRTNYIINKA